MMKDKDENLSGGWNRSRLQVLGRRVPNREKIQEYLTVSELGMPVCLVLFYSHVQPSYLLQAQWGWTVVQWCLSWNEQDILVLYGMMYRNKGMSEFLLYEYFQNNEKNV